MGFHGATLSHSPNPEELREPLLPGRTEMDQKKNNLESPQFPQPLPDREPQEEQMKEGFPRHEQEANTGPFLLVFLDNGINKLRTVYDW